jgi:hypothetical protein
MLLLLYLRKASQRFKKYIEPFPRNLTEPESRHSTCLALVALIAHLIIHFYC